MGLTLRSGALGYSDQHLSNAGGYGTQPTRVLDIHRCFFDLSSAKTQSMILCVFALLKSKKTPANIENSRPLSPVTAGLCFRETARNRGRLISKSAQLYPSRLTPVPEQQRTRVRAPERHCVCRQHCSECPVQLCRRPVWSGMFAAGGTSWMPRLVKWRRNGNISAFQFSLS